MQQLSSRQTLRLIHYGRKTGKPHQVTIWFVVADDKVYIGTVNVKRQWVRNVQKTPPVKMNIGGETFEGEARFLTDPIERERAKTMVRRKYWMYLPVVAVGQMLTTFGLIEDRSGFFEVTLKP